MSTDFERELRTEMERVPIRPRPDVVRVAFRHSRTRRRVIRAALAVGTAAATGIAMLVLSSVSSQPDAKTTAYVVSKMTSALTTANNDIMVYREDATVGRTHRTFSQTIWSYGGRTVTEVDDGNGQPYLSGLEYVRTSKGMEPAFVSVYYGHREVQEIVPFTDPMPGSAPSWSLSAQGICGQAQRGGLRFAMPWDGETSSQLASVMRGLLACGKISVTWNQRLGGTEAIKMVVELSYPASSVRTSSILWVSESTFLPIEQGFTSGSADSAPLSAVHYTWLPPTKANLRLLDVPIPAGFKIIQFPEFASAPAEPAPSATPASSRR
jgi:hypothetical protein